MSDREIIGEDTNKEIEHFASQVAQEVGGERVAHLIQPIEDPEEREGGQAPLAPRSFLDVCILFPLMTLLVVLHRFLTVGSTGLFYYYGTSRSFAKVVDTLSGDASEESSDVGHLASFLVVTLYWLPEFMIASVLTGIVPKLARRGAFTRTWDHTLGPVFYQLRHGSKAFKALAACFFVGFLTDKYYGAANAGRLVLSVGNLLLTPDAKPDFGNLTSTPAEPLVDASDWFSTNSLFLLNIFYYNFGNTIWNGAAYFVGILRVISDLMTLCGKKNTLKADFLREYYTPDEDAYDENNPDKKADRKYCWPWVYAAEAQWHDTFDRVFQIQREESIRQPDSVIKKLECLRTADRSGMMLFQSVYYWGAMITFSFKVAAFSQIEEPDEQAIIGASLSLALITMLVSALFTFKRQHHVPNDMSVKRLCLGRWYLPEGEQHVDDNDERVELEPNWFDRSVASVLIAVYFFTMVGTVVFTTFIFKAPEEGRPGAGIVNDTLALIFCGMYYNPIAMGFVVTIREALILTPKMENTYGQLLKELPQIRKKLRECCHRRGDSPRSGNHNGAGSKVSDSRSALLGAGGAKATVYGEPSSSSASKTDNAGNNDKLGVV